MERLPLSNPYNPLEYAIHSLRYLPLRGAVAGKRVLDIACGEGLGSELVRRWGARQVVGVDVSGPAIETAHAHFGGSEREGIAFVCSDACDYLESAGQDFDVIVSVETIEHLPDPRRFLELCRSRLTDGGSMLLSCPNDRYYYGAGLTMNPYHLESYGFEDFRKMAEEVLGAGQWSLGSVLNGFGLVPLEAAALEAADYPGALGRRRHLLGENIALPSSAADRLDTSNALFFVGAWGGLNLKPAYAANLPLGPDSRLPTLRNVAADVAIGRERRLAMVHDDTVSQTEIAALSESLAKKYALEPVSWAGDVEALIMALFEPGGFDNVHFESPRAFMAVAEAMEHRAAGARLGGTETGWSTAAISVCVANSGDLGHWALPLADAIVGLPAGTRHPELDLVAITPVFWSSSAPSPGQAAPRPPAALRVGIPRSNPIADQIAKTIAAMTTPDHRVVPQLLDADSGGDCPTNLGVLVCPDHSSRSRRLAEAAMGLGLPLVLPVGHPFLELSSAGQHELVFDPADPTTLLAPLHRLMEDRDFAGRIGRENLLVATEMATAAKGVAWARAFMRAEENRKRRGEATRRAALRAAATIARSAPDRLLQEAARQADELKAACEALRAENLACRARLTDLEALLKSRAGRD